MARPPKKIPPHISWIAQDSNGSWWGYTAEPHRNDFGWYENEVGEYIELGFTDPEKWQQSLQRVSQQRE